jgi:hypothetical protein
MSMRWYICHYPANPNFARQRTSKDGDDLVGSYSSFIWANSFRHARVLAKRRNIGEVVDGQWGGARSEPYPAASKMMAQKPMRASAHAHVIHAVSFLCYLLAQSCGMEPHETIGDDGLLHCVIHSLIFNEPTRKDMAATLRFFERKVPGYVKH